MLWLPGGDAAGELRVPLPALTELQLGWKLSPEVLYSFLIQCPALTRFVFRGKDKTTASVAIKGAAQIRSPQEAVASWCRAVDAYARRGPQPGPPLRDVAKALYRGCLQHSHLPLLMLGEGLFFNGQLDGGVVQLLRKLGPELLGQSVAGFVRAGQCDKLYQLLCACDRLDVYDASSILGWFVCEMRARLFEADMALFPRFLAFIGPSRLAGVFASLSEPLIRRIMEYLLAQQQPQAEQLFGQLLRVSFQNAHTVFAEGLLLAELIAAPGPFRESVARELGRQMEQLAAGEQPVMCDLLLLVLRSGSLREAVAALPWAGLASCKIVYVAGLLDAPLLLRLLQLLPPSLTAFAVRYNLHPREPVACVDDAVLAVLAARFPSLASLELDLTPALSAAAVRSLLAALPGLRVLQLRAPLLADEGVEAIVEHGGVETLRLQCAVRDIVLSRMGSQMARLQSLDLFDCPLVTVHGLERLANNSTSLWTLRVQDCRHVKLDSMQTKSFVKLLSSHRTQGAGVFSVKSQVQYK